MQREVDSHWPAVRGTHFVAPARPGPGRALLSRAIVRITPCSSRATLHAARREPLRALRLSARSVRLAPPAVRRGAARRLPAASSMRMAAAPILRGSEALAGLAQGRRLTAPGRPPVHVLPARPGRTPRLPGELPPPGPGPQRPRGPHPWPD